ncbi:hypothetical protein Fmac_026900 [Flemingia macrophylla]|uniref:Vta1/callose synthase N-terminal domain-containing protein n=1 Tax=Flemingia macrophylla TaxID=520843 RepID=A0ABD1LGE0_9FABA
MTMASTSGTNGPFETADWTKRLVRVRTKYIDDFRDEERVVDTEIVPSSLATLVPVLRAALAVEKENPRVAYLCRFHAFEKAHMMDPTSSGHGVRQFKTYLLNRLEKEEEITGHLVRRSDARELQNYYQQFYEKKIYDGEFTLGPEEMANNVHIATVLCEALKIIIPSHLIEEKTKRYAEDVERKGGQYKHYNILPLYAVGVKPAIMELPEIKAAINALCRVDTLPILVLRARPDFSYNDSKMLVGRPKKVNDILDWIASVFGFQVIMNILPLPLLFPYYFDWTFLCLQF